MGFGKGRPKPKTDVLEIKVTADLSDFPVVITTAEYEAYKQAVEVLEDREEEYYWLKKYNGALRLVADEQAAAAANAERRAEMQTAEARRMAVQVSYYRAASVDWHKTAIQRGNEVRHLQDELAKSQIQADETGAEIVALVRDGYGVRIEPGENFATVTVEKRKGEMRHANSIELYLSEGVNAVTAISNLAYVLNWLRRRSTAGVGFFNNGNV